MTNNEQWFLVPINPEPWKVPPFSPGRNKGGLYVSAGVDQQGAAFKEAVRESLIEQGAYMLRPPYILSFWFDRQLTGERNQVDVTNMQKLAEDALQGVVIDNDRNVVEIHSRGFPQNVDALGVFIVKVIGNADLPGIPLFALDRWIEHAQSLQAGPATDKDQNSWP